VFVHLNPHLRGKTQHSEYHDSEDPYNRKDDCFFRAALRPPTVGTFRHRMLPFEVARMVEEGHVLSALSLPRMC
jgi:hypothetical protein